MIHDEQGYMWAGHLTKEEVIGLVYNAVASAKGLPILDDKEIKALKLGIDYSEQPLSRASLVMRVRGLTLSIAMKTALSADGKTDCWFRVLCDDFGPTQHQAIANVCCNTLSASERQAMNILENWHPQAVKEVC